MNTVDRITEKEIEQKAEALLEKIGLVDSFPCPIEKVITVFGFTSFLFKPTDETKNISGVVYHVDHKIFINDQDSPQRRLFTAAHEVGHIILHPGHNHIDYRVSQEADSPKEMEADYFAACLLMPQKAFKKQWENFNGDTNLLSKFFGTSRKSIEFRADALGL